MKTINIFLLSVVTCQAIFAAERSPWLEKSTKDCQVKAEPCVPIIHSENGDKWISSLYRTTVSDLNSDKFPLAGAKGIELVLKGKTVGLEDMHLPSLPKETAVESYFIVQPNILCRKDLGGGKREPALFYPHYALYDQWKKDGNVSTKVISKARLYFGGKDIGDASNWLDVDFGEQTILIQKNENFSRAEKKPPLQLPDRVNGSLSYVMMSFSYFPEFKKAVYGVNLVLEPQYDGPWLNTIKEQNLKIGDALIQKIPLVQQSRIVQQILGMDDAKDFVQRETELTARINKVFFAGVEPKKIPVDIVAEIAYKGSLQERWQIIQDIMQKNLVPFADLFGNKKLGLTKATQEDMKALDVWLRQTDEKSVLEHFGQMNFPAEEEKLKADDTHLLPGDPYTTEPTLDISFDGTQIGAPLFAAQKKLESDLETFKTRGLDASKAKAMLDQIFQQHPQVKNKVTMSIRRTTKQSADAVRIWGVRPQYIISYNDGEKAGVLSRIQANKSGKSDWWGTYTGMFGKFNGLNSKKSPSVEWNNTCLPLRNAKLRETIAAIKDLTIDLFAFEISPEVQELYKQAQMTPPNQAAFPTEAFCNLIEQFNEFVDRFSEK